MSDADTLVGLLEETVRRFPDRPYLQTESGAVHYRAFVDQVERLAGHLAERGVRRGSRVVVAAPNSTELVLAIFAVMRCGAAAVLVDPATKRLELAELLEESAPQLLLCHSMLRPALDGLAEKLACVALDEPFERGPSVHALLAAPAPAAPDRPFAEDACLIVFTNGTSGTMLGATLSHRNVLSQLRALAERGVVTAESCLCAMLPLDHLFALSTGVFMPLLSGASALVLDVNRAIRDPEGAVEIMRSRRVDWLLSVPIALFVLPRVPAFSALAKQLTNIVSGGYALHASVFEGFLSGVGVPISEGYGLTEASPVVTFSRNAVAGSVGPALACCEIRVVDDQRRSLKVGEVGEIEVRGENVMSGYLNAPLATAQTIVDGWLRTGDLGKLDGHGLLYLTGLKKRMFNVMGKKVYPAEVERLMRSHPEVEHFALTATQDPLTGSVLQTTVQLRHDGKAEREFRALAQGEHLAAQAVQAHRIHHLEN